MEKSSTAERGVRTCSDVDGAEPVTCGSGGYPVKHWVFPPEDRRRSTFLEGCRRNSVFYVESSPV